MRSDSSFDDLYAGAYVHLRMIAARIGRHDRAAATLNPTALVNEAFLRLASERPRTDLDPTAIRRLAARAMRNVLIDAARRRLAARRGGGQRDITFLPEVHPQAHRPEALLALDAALERLAQIDTCQANIVELRFFGGYTVDETADLIGVSASTVAREWRMARAWLSRSISDET